MQEILWKARCQILSLIAKWLLTMLIWSLKAEQFWRWRYRMKTRLCYRGLHPKVGNALLHIALIYKIALEQLTGPRECSKFHASVLLPCPVVHLLQSLPSNAFLFPARSMKQIIAYIIKIYIPKPIPSASWVWNVSHFKHAAVKHFAGKSVCSDTTHKSFQIIQLAR